VLAELYAGAYKHPNSQQFLVDISELAQELKVLDFDDHCAEVFGRQYGSQARQGLKTPKFDLMIASVALVHDLTLVTHNTRDYRHVTGLRLEDWLSP
jgi:tRNA(fMet)-specific endonuclease VapC